MPGTSLIDKAQKDKFDKLEMDKGHEFNDQRPFRLSSLFDLFHEISTFPKIVLNNFIQVGKLLQNR